MKRISLLYVALLYVITSTVSANRLLKSTSLNNCHQTSDHAIQASRFNVVYTPNNNTVTIDTILTTTVAGKVVFDVAVSAYGYDIIQTTINPCDIGQRGLCPMMPGNIPYSFNIQVPEAAAGQIPGIAYTVPDLDATVRVMINYTETGKSVACVEANISNGKTVDLLGVKWATAAVIIIALIASAIFSALGYPNTAAHMAANSLSVLGYFQAQAILGLCGMPLPPIIQSWSQNLVWSLGVINVGFMQQLFTWYQRATGGTPSDLLSHASTVSVQVQKREAGLVERSLAMMPRVLELGKRASAKTKSGGYVISGIDRVAYKAGIEATNLFMTVLAFFVIIATITFIVICSFKAISKLVGTSKRNDYSDFREHWRFFLKGVLLRVTFLAFPPLAILCLWELTQRDSPAEVALAVLFLLAACGTLGTAAVKTILIARRSTAMYQSPGYFLFSDSKTLNTFGFLYIPFRDSASYFIVPILVYVILKALFVALSQENGLVQAIAFLVIEAAAVITASILRPWMDKSSNGLNITIFVVNFLNAIMLFIFCNVFNAPKLMIGIVGVVMFVLNAAASLILLLIVLVSTATVFFGKNPDARYRFMADNRASIMKSRGNLPMELEALAATAKGDKGRGKYKDVRSESRSHLSD